MPPRQKIDPFYEQPTLVLIETLWIPLPGKHTPATWRNIAQKAEAYLNRPVSATLFFIGPEAEFLFLMMSGLIPAATTRFIRWIPPKDLNTGRDEFPNLPTSRSTKRSISRCRPWISFRISAQK
ncbi:MAG: hypothetical protein R2860_09190 [Desulfobacterales bacterium]